MATADARRAHAKHGVRCVFGDGHRAWWNDIFLHNPKIARKEELGPDEVFAWVTNYPTNRPYIEAIEKGRFVYRADFKAEPGEIYLGKDEIRPKADYIVIEPNVKKDMTGPNKDWGWDNWVRLAKSLEGPLVQLGPLDCQRRIKRARHIVTRTFREAMSALSAARLYVGPDGGLHHAAAALGVPSVVLWGGVASPRNLGYDSHENVWTGAEPCGTVNRVCSHCRDAMASISVQMVLEAIERKLRAANQES